MRPDNIRFWPVDSEDQRLAIIDAENRTTRFAYDVLDRLTQSTDVAGCISHFEYDAAGRRTHVHDALDRVITYEYDDLDRVTAQVELGDSSSPRTETTYDAAGNRLSVKHPEGGTISYQYDALSRNTRVTQPLGQFVQYSYDNRDRVTSTVNARGGRIDYEYETWGPLKTQREYANTSSTTPLRTVSYTRDNDSNVLSIVDSDIQAGPAYTMTYDALSRIYDETVKYIPGGDKMLLRRYDRYGNRNEVTLLDGDPATNAYTYNKLNQLSKGVPAQFQDANATYYVHGDHLETARLMTDAAARVTWKSRHEAFGEAVVESDPDADGVEVQFNPRLPGQYADAESGLHYNYLRDYDPQTGRYLQSDPLGVDGGTNLFLYVNANPLNYADPTGEAGPAASAVAAVALLCARNPRLCAAILACLKNPKACTKAACNAACRSYQVLCKGGGRACDGSEGCYATVLKCGRNAGCCIGRGVCNICRFGGMGHRDRNTGQRSPSDPATVNDCKAAGKCCKQVPDKCGDCVQ